MLDVLEHLDHDHDAVAAATRLLRQDGIILCTVPACPWLWTKRDERHHHRRRYSKALFRKLFDQPGLHCELLSYFNTWLFPLAMMERLSSRIFESSRATTDLKIPSRHVNALLRRIFASEQAFLGRLSLPIGLSLIAVVRKTLSPGA